MSEILSREWLDDVTAWQPPDVRRPGQAVAPNKPAARPRTIHSAAELERLQKQAWEEAHAAGRREGLEKGLAEGRDEVRHQVRILKSMIQAVQKPLAAIDDEVEQELASLAVAIARHVIDDELRSDPARIVKLVPQAIADLPAGSREVRVRVHPDDAELLHEHLPDGDGEASWSLVEDAAVRRGGCRIDSPTSSVDATLETRLDAVVARVFGEDDDADDGGAPA
ncbi:flagellar assembly protein FliH [Wenzhouxiangella limi]|uniref:Flagellar assembly protein FliH n=1 Tax=Wenzhouxiangella limi TaxID=2707351 RepID=A0A845V4B7_9GAMM|nr:flagellar assembly protein FliH [Wenzhouxiangella limi]NDY97140.1 flagellar assembly protein FliH [Wenzhouxiangella limi]